MTKEEKPMATDNKQDPRERADRSASEAAAWASSHSALERTLQAGIHGAPELRKDEKQHYLGEFRERVLKVLTRQQMAEAEVYDEIRSALNDPRAEKLVIDGSTPDRHNDKYEKLAASLGKPYTVRRDADFQGDIGLIVVSAQAVDVPDDELRVKTREERLSAKGVPERLIQAVGKKVCVSCYALIQEKAPEEKPRYSVMTMLDRLFGEPCPGHEEG
jgi:uncharacterized protein YueI